jgi:hypothetical protein
MSRVLSITGHWPSLEELDVTTNGVLGRVDIEAPLLKKLSIYAPFGISKDFSFSYSAPKLEELSWKCGKGSGFLSHVRIARWRGRMSRRGLDLSEVGGTGEVVEDVDLRIGSNKLISRGTEIGVRGEEDFMEGDILVSSGDRGNRKICKRWSQVEHSSMT